eukprot:GFYU01008694.1.p1 GENE.GFYU01008694.1~~GFYU01008694.1.p1  ORF type:complete len:274 (+),score=30.42 GFYU01008694.1:169-990(+)
MAAGSTAVGQWFASLNPDIPVEVDTTGGKACSWFLSPEQHIVEFLLYSLVFLPSAIKSVCNGVWSKKATGELKPTDAMDWLLALWLGFSLGAIVVFKWVSDKMVYLVSPCHMLNLALLICCLWRNQFTANLFNIYLHIHWSAWLAILQPDLRNHKLPYEVEVFWSQHFALVVVPVVLMYRREYPTLPAKEWAVHALYSLYHAHFLNTVGFATNYNLNYLCHPPPGPLDLLGVYYRPGQYIICYFLTVLTRRLYVEGWNQVFCKFTDTARSKVE